MSALSLGRERLKSQPPKRRAAPSISSWLSCRPDTGATNSGISAACRSISGYADPASRMEALGITNAEAANCDTEALAT